MIYVNKRTCFWEGKKGLGEKDNEEFWESENKGSELRVNKDSQTHS